MVEEVVHNFGLTLTLCICGFMPDKNLWSYVSSSHSKIELVSRQKVISKGVDETSLSLSSSLSGYYGNTGCEKLFMGGIQN